MTASHGPIYACPDPDCSAALIEREEGLYCPCCEIVYAWAKIAGDP